MSQSSVDEKFAAFISSLQSDREVLRRKVGALIRKFNSGSPTVTRWGVTINVVDELEAMLAKTSDRDCREALAILRE